MTNANSLSSAFIDLATYGELESKLYGNRLRYTNKKFNFFSQKEKIKPVVMFITAIGFIINYAYKYNLTYFEPCDLLQKIFLIASILTLFFIIF